MKVIQLIELLKLHDPNKEVFIQQGQDFDYMTIYTVRPLDVINDEDEEPTSAIVIEYS